MQLCRNRAVRVRGHVIAAPCIRETKTVVSTAYAYTIMCAQAERHAAMRAEIVGDNDAASAR